MNLEKLQKMDKNSITEFQNRKLCFYPLNTKNEVVYYLKQKPK